MALNANAKAWVAALRSGEYAQGHEQLRVTRPDGSVGHCCLGVGGDLFVKETGEAHWLDDFLMYHNSTADEECPIDTGTLDAPFAREWLGLTHDDGTYMDESSGHYLSLAGKNDQGATFDEIADIIESEPKGLFVTS